MRRHLIVGLVLATLPACGAGALRESHLSDPVVTDDGTVWWAEHRAHARGTENRTRVIMCRRGERPVCIRVQPVDGSAR